MRLGFTLYRASLAMIVIAASTRIAFAGCPQILAALGDRIADATCVESTDLTTNNPATTPPDNSIAGLPTGAFTPMTDRAVIAPPVAERTPIERAVPGVQIAGRITSDPSGQARFLMRFPAEWNGRLIVAGASGTRSEFNGDLVWSDFAVQHGYAYASQNKGVLNLRIASAASPTQPVNDALSCRLNPASQTWVHFFDNDAGKPFTEWTRFMIEDAVLAKRAVVAQYRRPARYTYAVGVSNGGYQVRRAIENAPLVFDAGLDWEGTHVDPRGPTLLTDLPPAITSFPAYAAANFDGSSAAAQAIEAAGYPPDLVSGAVSLWGLHYNAFWEVTQCQWQKRFDPKFATYVGGPNDITGTGGYPSATRAAGDPAIARGLAQIATTGKIRRPLITIAGTLDALLPVAHHARRYAALVRKETCPRRKDAGADCDEDLRARRGPAYRLYEVQNGNHVDGLRGQLPALELIGPHAIKAFELLVAHVEQGARLPPSQCIARGAELSPTPEHPGTCAQLKAP